MHNPIVRALVPIIGGPPEWWDMERFVIWQNSQGRFEVVDRAGYPDIVTLGWYHRREDAEAHLRSLELFCGN